MWTKSSSCWRSGQRRASPRQTQWRGRCWLTSEACCPPTNRGREGGPSPGLPHDTTRLASQLTGWSIDILTEEEERSRREKEANSRTELFMGAIDVDEMMARLLVSEGFETIEELAYVELGDLLQIEGFDEDVSAELQARARDFIERAQNELNAKRASLGVEDEVLGLPGVTLEVAIKLGEGGVKNVEDVAGLVSDDLRGWFEVKNGEKTRFPGLLEGMSMSVEQADALIMAARVAMGWVEAPVVEEAEAEAEVAADGQE